MPPLLDTSSTPYPPGGTGQRGAEDAMLSTSMSPRDQGYAAESLDDLDLESRSGQAGESSHAQMEEDSKDKSFQRAGTKDSRFMHPDDSVSAVFS